MLIPAAQRVKQINTRVFAGNTGKAIKIRRDSGQTLKQDTQALNTESSQRYGPLYKTQW